MPFCAGASTSGRNFRAKSKRYHVNTSPSRLTSAPAASAHGERVLQCGRLLLRFYWRGDRFAHAVSRADAPDAGPLLESLEGSASEAWPPSGPLQSLHLERQSGSSQVALLVGLAGKSHWSAAVELFPEQSRLRWDVACRVAAGTQGRLGSSYLGKGRLQMLDSRIALFGEAQANASGLAVRLDRSVGPVRLVADRDHLEIVAEPDNCGTSAATVRWSYFIEALDS